MIFKKIVNEIEMEKIFFFLSTPFVESNSLEVSVQKFDVLKKKIKTFNGKKMIKIQIQSFHWIDQ